MLSYRNVVIFVSLNPVILAQKDMRFCILVVVFLILYGCSRDHSADCIKRTGKITSTVRPLNAIKGLKLFSKINYTLIPDTVNEVRIEAGSNILPYITTEITNGELTVVNTMKCKFARSYKPEVNCYIHIRDTLNYILFEGSGALSCRDTIKSPKILLECNDASKSADLLLDVNTFDFRQYSGSADFTMRGKVGLLYLFAAGSGTMHCENLETIYTYATAKNVSKCYVYATYELGAEVLNWGQIFYRGNPKVINKIIKDKGIVQQIQ
jgi:hypothetical protein